MATTVTTLGRKNGDCPVKASHLADKWARLVWWRRLVKDNPAWAGQLGRLENSNGRSRWW
jgi:hypothetical protein